MPTKTKESMIVGNWKMYKTLAEAEAFVKGLTSTQTAYLAVPFTLLQPLTKIIPSHVVLGAQNMNDASEGAFTGEVSARMIKDAGAKFVILGHSERRTFFKEDNAFIQRKVERAINEKIEVILCVGETLEEHEGKKTEEVLKKQLLESLGKVSAFDLISIAYEPVWAIGTGHACDPEVAQNIHHYLHTLAPKVSKILYGGSVKPDNAAAYLKEKDINGLLIGGASLNVESFDKILSLT